MLWERLSSVWQRTALSTARTCGQVRCVPMRRKSGLVHQAAHSAGAVGKASHDMEAPLELIDHGNQEVSRS